ncbi:MAG TPA: hypothetical protein VMW16_12305 [Sedimentisphaerales bacterium]|nr:hypothetical protein [Sedimentisphaerales bacterium]
MEGTDTNPDIIPAAIPGKLTGASRGVAEAGRDIRANSTAAADCEKLAEGAPQHFAGDARRTTQAKRHQRISISQRTRKRFFESAGVPHHSESSPRHTAGVLGPDECCFLSVWSDKKHMAAACTVRANRGVCGGRRK